MIRPSDASGVPGDQPVCQLPQELLRFRLALKKRDRLVDSSLPAPTTKRPSSGINRKPVLLHQVVQTSVTAGTIMHHSKLPLTTWFWAAYLMATHSNGIAALQLQHQLALGSYK